MRAIPLLLFLLVAVSGAASAWPLNQHVVIQNGDTQVFVGTDLDLVTLAFRPSGAPVFDGVMINLTSGSGYGNWTLTHYNPTDAHFVLNGTLTSDGALQLSGPANNYIITGISPLALQTGGASLRVYDLDAGTYTVDIIAVPSTTQVVGRAIAENIGSVLALVLAGSAMTVLGVVFVASNKRR